MAIQTSVAMIVNAPVAKVFEIASSIAPNELIKPHTIFPGIDREQTIPKPWAAPGDVRHHKLTDQTSVTEELTSFAVGENFSYNISGFSGAFATLTKTARADWCFTPLALERSRIDWSYYFNPTGPIAEPLLWFVIKLGWPGYLRAALERLRTVAEVDVQVTSDAT